MVTRDADESVRGVLDTIAAVLARFHERAERSRVINAQGEVGAIDQRWRENLSELNRYADTPISGGRPSIANSAPCRRIHFGS